MCYRSTPLVLCIRLFPMLVATGSFSPERGLPVKFCVNFNHFKSIIMRAFFAQTKIEMLISEQR